MVETVSSLNFGGSTMVVAVLGASNKAHRYSYKALKMLEQYDHRPLPIHPKLEKIDGWKVYPSLSAIEEEVDTLTLYVGEKRSSAMADEILELGAKRVIFNPGAENQELEERLQETGAEVLRACTLVMLKTGRF